MRFGTFLEIVYCNPDRWASGMGGGWPYIVGGGGGRGELNWSSGFRPCLDHTMITSSGSVLAYL